MEMIFVEDPVFLVFDMDGLICENGYSGRYDEAPPYQHAIDIINRLHAERDEQGRRVYYIRIQTARYMARHQGHQGNAEHAGSFELCEWLQKHGVKFDELYFGKASADLYTDDHGCRVESAKGSIDWENNFFPALAAVKAKKYANSRVSL